MKRIKRSLNRTEQRTNFQHEITQKREISSNIQTKQPTPLFNTFLSNIPSNESSPITIKKRINLKLIENKKVFKTKITLKNFKSIEKQQEYFDELFYHLKLNSVDEWLQIYVSQLQKYESAKRILTCYQNNIKPLLISIYPHFPWHFVPKEYFKSIEKQREFMDDLFIKLNLNSLDDWLVVPIYKIEMNGGRKLMSIYYDNIEKLLINIYPNYQFNFIKKKSLEYFKSIENQKEFMDDLFIKLNLNSLDDWIHLSKLIIKKNGGKYLLLDRNFHAILQFIYPNYPWNFSSPKFKTIENQNLFMNNLFIKFKLIYLDDWLKIKKNDIKKSGGKGLLRQYKFNMKNLLSTIYPNYPWQFIYTKFYHLQNKNCKEKILQEQILQEKFCKENENDNKNENNKLKVMKKHVKKMERLFNSFQLKTIDDWLGITRTKLRYNGGEDLILYYKNIRTILLSIYPNYPWNFGSIEKEFMDKLFIKFKLKSFDDWMNISTEKFIQNGGEKLLNEYENDLKKILFSIYPNYPWHFPDQKNLKYLKLKELIEKYSINQKKDWYRLPVDSHAKYEIFHSLKYFYPYEKWKKSNFQSRTKKTSQRLLFSFAQKIYPSLLIFENYFHPKLTQSNNKTLSFELDIFIPALQLAMEYQGEQHYDDIPSGFGAGSMELTQSRDKVKEKLVSDLNIKIIYIPYWWDQSLSSLQSSLQSS